ncbi:MAG: hypothetical protein ACRC1R_08625 [Cetobacterium sp.]|uniref:hypothetical protein n=1 Tax=Cetobacterium sp. TaxID=2071632 RepID=UPI003F364088
MKNRNTELSKERQDQYKLLRGKQSFAQSYRHRLTLKTGIESIQLFESNVVLKNKTAQGQWNAKGNALSSNSKNDAKLSSNINGAIGTAEYGLSENSSLGYKF